MQTPENTICKQTKQPLTIFNFYQQKKFKFQHELQQEKKFVKF